MATKGWLPFGSNDASVLFQHSLKTALVSADLNGNWSQLYIGSSALSWDLHGSVLHGHDVTHDSVLGMKAVSSADGSTECGYRFASQLSPLDAATNEGQLSFEVESEWYCVNDSANGTSGASLGAESQSILSTLAQTAPTGGAAVGEIVKTGANKPIPIFFVNSVGYDYRNFNPTSTGALAAPYSPGKSRFIAINIGWKGKYVWYAIDGVIVNFAERPSDGWVNAFNNFYLGNDRGGADTFVDGYWMRNLQISNKAPRFDLLCSAKKIAVLSDSLFDDQIPAHGTSGDVNPQYRIYRAFEQKGNRCNLHVSENAGFHVSSAQASTLHDQVAALLAENPSAVILQGGTNDAGASLAASTFETEYKSLIEKLIGVNGNTSTAKKIFICTPPPRADSATFNGFITEYVAVIKSLKSWFDTTYSSSGKELHVVDVHSAVGGTIPIDGVLQSDNIHYAALGCQIYGDTIAAKLLSNL